MEGLPTSRLAFSWYPSFETDCHSNIQSIFKDSLSAAGITQSATVHTLHHCFATHLLNNFSSLLQIKELLGHDNIQTTSMYLHLTHAQVLGVKSPFDLEGDDLG